MLKNISIHTRMAEFGHVKLRKSGNSMILTVPHNPYTNANQEYQVFLKYDGTILYKPIKERK